MMFRLSLLFLLFFSSYMHPQSPFENMLQDFVNQDFGNSHKFTLQELIILPHIQKNIENMVGQRFASTSLIYGKITLFKHTEGYYFVDTLMGKNYTFDVLVFFDKDTAIKSVHILRNPDPHNQAIAQKAWLRQFTGKKADIDAGTDWKTDSLSGATFSAKALEKGLRRLCLLLNTIIKP